LVFEKWKDNDELLQKFEIVCGRLFNVIYITPVHSKPAGSFDFKVTVY
jgi:hypothetical protein